VVRKGKGGVSLGGFPWLQRSCDLDRGYMEQQKTGVLLAPKGVSMWEDCWGGASMSVLWGGERGCTHPGFWGKINQGVWIVGGGRPGGEGGKKRQDPGFRC